MTDLWDIVGNQADADINRRLIEAARFEVAPYRNVITGAKTEEDFANRMALATDKIDAALARVIPTEYADRTASVRSTVLADFRRDFKNAAKRQDDRKVLLQAEVKASFKKKADDYRTSSRKTAWGESNFEVRPSPTPGSNGFALFQGGMMLRDGFRSEKDALQFQKEQEAFMRGLAPKTQARRRKTAGQMPQRGWHLDYESDTPDESLGDADGYAPYGAEDPEWTGKGHTITYVAPSDQEGWQWLLTYSVGIVKWTQDDEIKYAVEEVTVTEHSDEDHYNTTDEDYDHGEGGYRIHTDLDSAIREMQGMVNSQKSFMQMQASRKTAADDASNPYSGGGDYSTDTTDPEAQQTDQMAATPGGDDMAPQAPSSSSTVTSKRYTIACFECGQMRHQASKPRNRRCLICGSTKLFYEAYTHEDVINSLPVSWVPQDEKDPPSAAMRFSSGITGLVTPNPDEGTPGSWIWIIENEHYDGILAQGWANSRDQAMRLVENTAPTFERPMNQAHRKTAEFPPKKKDDDSDDKDKKDDSSSDDSGDSAPPVAGGDTSAPPVGAPVPPAGANGADPQNPTKDAPAPEDDPNLEQPVDPAAAVPGAPVDPNAAPVGTDPLDRAQATLDAQVEAVNALGHDAMESAYDVDDLFSEWRCMNCGLEGRADISDDGQVAFSGDLLEQPQGCTAPAQAVPGAPPVDPAADPAQTAIQPAVPADDGSATPDTGKTSKRKFLRNPFKRTAEAENSEERELNGDEPQQIAEEAESETAETKIATMVEQIKATHPHMTEAAARAVAKETIRRFPTVVAKK